MSEQETQIQPEADDSGSVAVVLTPANLMRNIANQLNALNDTFNLAMSLSRNETVTVDQARGGKAKTSKRIGSAAARRAAKKTGKKTTKATKAKAGRRRG